MMDLKERPLSLAQSHRSHGDTILEFTPSQKTNEVGYSQSQRQWAVLDFGVCRDFESTHFSKSDGNLRCYLAFEGDNLPRDIVKSADLR